MILFAFLCKATWAGWALLRIIGLVVLCSGSMYLGFRFGGVSAAADARWNADESRD